MARTRQKAKQRKAKRLEQERKAAERAQGRGTGADPVDGSAAEALAEIEEAQVRAAQELDEAQEVEVGAGAEAARSAAAAEAATAAEVATTGRSPQAASSETLPAKPSRRERRRAQQEVAEKETKPARAERRREPKPTPKPERKREARPRGRVVNFLKQVWAELRRVQWPNRNQVTQASAVVIVFCFIAGGYLAIWDFFFSRLIKAIL
jgi:preprotein translocase SecE subunit